MRLPEPFSSEQIKSLAASGLFERAKHILAERRLWKFEDRLDDEGEEKSAAKRNPPVPVRTAGALVLEGAPEPYRVLWNGNSWSCECNAAKPCVHLAALLLHLADKRSDDERLAAVAEAAGRSENDSGKDSEPPRSLDSVFAIPPSSSPLSIFTEVSFAENDDSTDLNPSLDLLFFTEPVSVETRDVMILGPAAEVNAVLTGGASESRSAAPLSAAHPAGSPPSPPSSPKVFLDLSKHAWRAAEAEVLLKHDGGFSRFRRKKTAAAGRIEEKDGTPPNPEGSGIQKKNKNGVPADETSEEKGSAAFDSIAAALESKTPPLTPDGRSWNLTEAKRLILRFDPLLSPGDGEPLYEPVPLMALADSNTAAGQDASGKKSPAGKPEDSAAEETAASRRQNNQAAEESSAGTEGEHVHQDFPPPRTDGDRTARPLDRFGGGLIGGGSRSCGLFTGAGDIIMLDAPSATAARLTGASDSLWFVRLILSRRVMSASDIRARFYGTRGVPAGIDIDLPDLPETLEMLTPTPVLEIIGGDGYTDLLPRWKYAGTILQPGAKGEIVMGGTGLRPRPLGLRDKDAENAAMEKIEGILAMDLAWRRGRYFVLTGEEALPFRMETPMADVLAEYAAPLMDAGVEIRLENRPIRRGGAVGVSIKKTGDLMEISTAISCETLDLDEWLDKGGLVRTRDSYFRLTQKALDQLLFLRANGMNGGGFLSTSPNNLSLIDAVYEETVASEELQADLERRRNLYRDLSDFTPENITPPPESFRASLRPYQMLGYAWLLHLRNNGLGACLADDMGLGKTVQTLAYLARLRADGKLRNVLLVGPVVTLANWGAEIRRFTPSFTVHKYSGPAEKRFLPAEDSGTDIVLVSYQTLRNDAERFLERDWDHIILDEAHYVKNASSKTFKAVRSLRAEHRISLTGTPLENHLNELWSQMTFLNPGLLGSQSRFIENYVRPVEFGTDDKALTRLSDTVAPFLLRRRKEEVLDDLPPKDETVLRCDMTDDQSEAYDAMRETYRRQVTGMISADGLDGSRIEILSVLSKLRLLAIHPPLAGEPFTGISSGKMAVLDSLLEEILEENHKILLFSQFLGALDRAEQTCKKHEWRYSRLTGATKNREDQIKDFNENPETKVFLLSLKAGGVGINLTSADYVVLLDPWWNPAVEAQAVDRAHRMGQTRPVMVYRLITSGTIEEKVLELQEQKKDLIAGVLGDGGSPALTEDEIMNLLD